jgi:microcystin-dependent protein
MDTALCSDDRVDDEVGFHPLQGRRDGGIRLAKGDHWLIMLSGLVAPWGAHQCGEAPHGDVDRQLSGIAGDHTLRVENQQPSLGVTYLIRTTGQYPGENHGSLSFLGEVIQFAGNYAPTGFMRCDGRLLSVLDHDELFQIIGNAYGGDGVTTFALPDMRGRNAVGASASVPLGSKVGDDEVVLSGANMPTEMGGAGAEFDNRGPGLALRYIISLQGIFPTQDTGSANPNEPYYGEITLFAGNFAPRGWALCEGQLLPIHQNTALFSILLNNYGGNGTTHFALPDLRGRTSIGASDSVGVGTVVGSNLAEIDPSDLPNLDVTGSAGADMLFGGGSNDTLRGLGGSDKLTGNGGVDRLEGGEGNDTYFIGSDNDRIIDTGGIDRIVSTKSRSLVSFAEVEHLTLGGGANLNGTGNVRANTITGNVSDNTLSGAAANDRLIGGQGSDRLIGGTGIDTLTGGADGDTFIFNVAPGAANRDVVTDFDPNVDLIQLQNSVFTRLTRPGTLPEAFFARAGAAQDGNDFIIYNRATGVLLYDADANRPGAALEIARFTNKPLLTAGDFTVI